MALICINPNFREVNDVNTNSAIFGYRIIKIYEGIKIGAFPNGRKDGKIAHLSESETLRQIPKGASGTLRDKGGDAQGYRKCSQ